MELELSSLPLALFTTLAPAGLVAFVWMAVLRMETKDARKAVVADHLLGIPFMLVLSGFITSTVHLGTPANALYVLTGVGRSPLSNEVVAMLAFLVLSGSYWMCAMRRPLRAAVAAPWLVAASLAAVGALVFTSVAYVVRTIPTWNLVHAPFIQVVCALGAGALVAGNTGSFVERGGMRGWAPVACCGLSCAVCVLASALYWKSLVPIATFVQSASDLVAAPVAWLLGYASFSVAGVACAVALRRCASCPLPVRVVLAAVSSVGALVGFFVLRVYFYQLYMTVGI